MLCIVIAELPSPPHTFTKKLCHDEDAETCFTSHTILDAQDDASHSMVETRTGESALDASKLACEHISAGEDGVDTDRKNC